MSGFWESLFSWDALWWVMVSLYLPSCMGLIAVVLLQKGKGAGFAGAFGVGGGSDAVFGPRASKSLPARMTTIMATIFMVLAFTLSLIEGRLGKGVAPEKVAETAVTTPESSASELDSLGLGQGSAAEPSVDTAPAPTPAPTPAPDAAAPEAAAPAETPASESTSGTPAPEAGSSAPPSSN